MDALQRSVPVPQHEIEMRGALRRQVSRQELPLAARGEDVEDRVENIADNDAAPAAAAPRARNERSDESPLLVGQITRISAPEGPTDAW